MHDTEYYLAQKICRLERQILAFQYNLAKLKEIKDNLFPAQKITKKAKLQQLQLFGT